MKRRTAIKGVGAAAVGGIAFTLMSGSAVAGVEEHEFTGTTIEGESDDGVPADVVAGARNIVFSYEGLNDEAEEATVALEVSYEDDNKEIDSVTTTDIDGTSDRVSIDDELEGSVLDHPDLEAKDFEAEEDGGNFDKTVELRLVVYVDTEGDDTVDNSDEPQTADLEVIMHNRPEDVDGSADATGMAFEEITASDDGWVTLLGNFEDVATFRIELNDEVYGNWPNDPEGYFQEIVLRWSDDEDDWEYRFGFHGGDGEGSVGHGGYVKDTHKDDPYETIHESNYDGFTAFESDDQHTYEIVIDEDGDDIDFSLDTFYVEAWGLDGGEGLEHEDYDHIDVSTGWEYHSA